MSNKNNLKKQFAKQAKDYNDKIKNGADIEENMKKMTETLRKIEAKDKKMLRKIRTAVGLAACIIILMLVYIPQNISNQTMIQLYTKNIIWETNTSLQKVGNIYFSIRL